MMPWHGVYHEVVYPGEKELVAASPAPEGMKVGRERVLERGGDPLWSHV